MKLMVMWKDRSVVVEVNDRTHAVNYVKALMKRWKADQVSISAPGLP